MMIESDMQTLKEQHLFKENKKLNDKINNLDKTLAEKGFIGKTPFKCYSCDYASKFKALENDDEEDVCPNCFITTPETITLHEIKENITKNSQVLQLNAKEGLYNYFMNNLESPDNYTSLSIEDSVFNKKISDYANTNLDNDSFDLIVAIHIIDMIENDTQTLKEMCRLLKKDGKLIIKANADFDLKNSMEKLKVKSAIAPMFYGNLYSLRNYGKDLIKKIEEIGFTVTYKDPTTLPTTKLTREQLTLDPILVCTKKD